MAEKTIKAIVTLEVKAVVRKDTTIEDLIKNHTDFILEPKSVNGCVMSQKVIEVKEL